jgi:UDP-N-acetylmuramate--alanine ligase
MSGIALLLKENGYDVQGSDIKENQMVRILRDRGIRVFIGHSRENVRGADVVTHSSAVKGDNIEIVEAERLGIPVVPRAEVLSDITRLKETIAVAGTHGKTTTSSMIATVLHMAGLEPTVLVGGRLSLLGGANALTGAGKWLVVEADESDGTFLRLSPTVSVITNIDSDHLDFYRSVENLRNAFLEFANRTSFYGMVFMCGECPRTREVFKAVRRRKATFGFSSEFDFSAQGVKPAGTGCSFTVVYRGTKLGSVELSVPGRHNVLNALVAVAVSLEVGIPFKEVARCLKAFRNASRRMELKGTVNGVTFVDDYAHHPTEIVHSYRAVKESFPGRRIVVLFQPHRFTRTKILWKEFVSVLSSIENLYLCEVFPAGEKPIEGVTAERLAKECGAVYCGSLEQACREIKEVLKPGDVFLSMGAGDVTGAFKLITGQ